MRKNDELIAGLKGNGVYGLPYFHQVVKHGNKYYLLYDAYCGEGSVKGGCYRHSRHRISPSLMPEIQKIFDNADTIGLMNLWERETGKRLGV